MKDEEPGRSRRLPFPKQEIGNAEQLLGLVYTSPTAAPVRALLRVRESDELLHKSVSVHTVTHIM